MNRPNIDDVRDFWNAAPLWTGESDNAIGSPAFFEEHRAVYHRDCFAGRMDPRIFPQSPPEARILDLGCGIGFWLVEFWQRGFRNLHGADLSAASLQLARRRCEVLGVEAELSERNAEATGFEPSSFDHVNCQGVIHHTPSPAAAVAEIHRILRPGGTASISVYYKNAVLRHWRHLRPMASLVSALGGGLKGRGRESIMSGDEIDDIVRRYDGEANPIGIAYSRTEFEALIGSQFTVEETYFHFFPARALPFGVPAPLHRVLDRRLPFMIYCNLRKTDG